MSLVLFLLLGSAADLSADMAVKVRDFQELSLDVRQAVAVTGFVIDYGSLKLTLAEGLFYPSDKIDNKVYAGHFHGKATFSYKPTDFVELQQLRNQSRILSRAVHEIQLELTDIFIRSTSDILLKFGQPAQVTPRPDHDPSPWDALKTVINTSFSDQAIHFLAKDSDSINYGDDTLFAFHTPDYGDLVLRDSDWDRREVSLSSFNLHKRPEMRTWAEYDRDNEHTSPIRKAVEHKDLIHITHYDMTVTIPKSLDFMARIVMRIQPLVDGLNGVALDFAGSERGFGPRIRIDRLKIVEEGGSGIPLAFVHTGEKLFLRPSSPWQKDKLFQVEITYRASNFQTTSNGTSEVMALLNTVAWFPQYGYKSRYTFDWMVATEKPYLPVVSGSTLRRWEEDGLNWVHSREQKTVSLAAIIIGKYSFKSGTSRRPHIYAFTSVANRRKQDELLGLSRAIIRYYENLFGDFPLAELNVAQMFPGLGFSQAPPGLVQMTGEAFWTKDKLSRFGGRATTFSRSFLAHEIAHQWWAHKLGANAPESAWFIEAMASYSAMCFIHKWKGQKGINLEMKGWADFIRRDYANNRTRNLGPVAMGEHRLGRSTLGAYFGKGPHVLHSLRHQMGAKDFFGALRSLADAYAFQNITTYHLLIAFNRQTGKEWGPFFDEFLLSKGGNPKVHYSVEQFQEGEDRFAEFVFQPQDPLTSVTATVPVSFQLNDEIPFSARVLVEGKGNTARVKIPQIAKRIEINPEKEIYIAFSRD